MVRGIALNKLQDFIWSLTHKMITNEIPCIRWNSKETNRQDSKEVFGLETYIKTTIRQMYYGSIN